MKLTLLGTGTPIPNPVRRGPSQVIEAGNELVLIDCGSGAMHRLMDAGYAQPDGRHLRLPLRQIALTHLHSDHITGLPDLLWAGWIMDWWSEPPPIVGPPGTATFVEFLLRAFQYDIRVRLAGDRAGSTVPAPRVEEVEENAVTEGSDWRLTAFRVEHEPVDQAFGYRLDSEGEAAVISGDTRYSENLIRHAQGADLLVHEVYWRAGMEARLAAATTAQQRARAETVASYHTPADEVGKVADRAEVKQLVLSHILLYGGTPNDLIEDIRPQYRGTITSGEDLQMFDLSLGK
ncbi:MAG: MBL fold metallo-hydrolase [Dehalococcoidia bacterium]